MAHRTWRTSGTTGAAGTNGAAGAKDPKGDRGPRGVGEKALKVRCTTQARGNGARMSSASPTG